MNKKYVVMVAALAIAVVAGTAMAAPPPAPSVQKILPMTPVTWTCPGPSLLPPITTVQTDWSLDSPQGWLDHGQLAQGTTELLFQCYYGVDKADPAARPAFWIHRAIPANYLNCTLDGPKRTSMTCQIPAAAPPKRSAAP
jgi:hypothetical protein